MRINLATAATTGVAGILCLGLVVQWVQIQSLAQRLTALEAATPAAVATLDLESNEGGKPNSPGSSRSSTRHPKATPQAVNSTTRSIAQQSAGALIHDDEIQEQIVGLVDEAQERLQEERRENWCVMMRERMFDVVAEVARNAELSETDEEQLGRIIDGYMAERRLIWEDVHEGSGSITEAENESEALKAEIQQDITSRYGSAVFAVVEERLLDRHGRH